MILTHYGASMRPKALTDQVVVMVQKFIERFTDPNDRIVLFYSGMSGVASATALTTVISVATDAVPSIASLVYVRKEHERSHGEPIEISVLNDIEPTDRLIPIFIDDFICSGDTFLYVKKQVAKYRKKYNGLFYSEDENCKQFHNKLSLKKNWWIVEVDRGSLKRAHEVI